MDFFKKRRSELIEKELKEEYGITIRNSDFISNEERQNDEDRLNYYTKTGEPIIDLARQLALFAGNYSVLSKPTWTVTLDGIAVLPKMLREKNNGSYLLNTKTETNKFGVMADLDYNDNSISASMNVASAVWAIAAYVTQKHYLEQIDKSLVEIQKTVNDIKQFIEKDKQSQVEADLFLLHEIVENVQEIKTNSSLTVMKLNQTSSIQREAKRNTIFYENEIKNKLGKYSAQKKQEPEKKQLEELRKNYWYYNLSMQIYALSLIVEAILSDNMDVKNLQKLKMDLQEHDLEYIEVCDKIISTVYGYNYNKLGSKVGIAFADVLDLLGRASSHTPLEKLDIDNKLKAWGKNGKQGVANRAKKTADKIVSKEEKSLLSQYTHSVDRLYNIYYQQIEMKYDDGVFQVELQNETL